MRLPEVESQPRPVAALLGAAAEESDGALAGSVVVGVAESLLQATEAKEKAVKARINIREWRMFYLQTSDSG